MSRFVDRGAIVAAYVGIGMAVTMAISFLLVIPIEPAYVLLSIPGGLIIGYYANARSNRTRGEWRRILPNALLVGAVTGLTLAALRARREGAVLLRRQRLPGLQPASTRTGVVHGADLRLRRRLRLPPLPRSPSRATSPTAGITDSASFANVYWEQQWSTARLLLGTTTGAALIGGFLFGIAGPRRAAPRASERCRPRLTARDASRERVVPVARATTAHTR